MITFKHKNEDYCISWRYHNAIEIFASVDVMYGEWSLNDTISENFTTNLTIEILDLFNTEKYRKYEYQNDIIFTECLLSKVTHGERKKYDVIYSGIARKSPLDNHNKKTARSQSLKRLLKEPIEKELKIKLVELLIN